MVLPGRVSIAFLNTVTPEDVCARISERVLVCAGRRGQEASEIGRRFTRRELPW